MSRTTSSSKDKKKSNILIIDDHPVLRHGLALMLNHEEDLAVCGDAENLNSALKAIKTLKPDLALLDVSLKSSNGIDVMKKIKIRFPDLPVLVLSMHDEGLYAERALRAGARGYLMKKESPEKVVHAIRKVLRGEIYLSDRMEASILNQIARGGSPKSAPSIERLSDRELEVFNMIGQGLGTRQIAEELGLSIKTIESYREHIKRKMHLQNGTQLFKQAIHWSNSQNLG